MLVLYRARLLSLLFVLGILALPPLVLRAACVGRTCEEPGESAGRVPFCSLPADLQDRLAAGYREGRSPDVLAVSRAPELRGWDRVSDVPAVQTVWPSAGGGPSEAVPLVFWGTGVRRGAQIPPGTALSSVAPTVLELTGDSWAFPDVHDGVPITRLANGQTPRLVLLVVMKGVGSDALDGSQDHDTALGSLLETSRAGTLDAVVGSSPTDPAATLTTIGSGATPSEHGIVGTYLRNDETGALARAWSRGAPLSIIAGLGDDLDRSNGDRALVGMAGTDPADLGLVGGNWYPDGDRDVHAFVPSAKVPAAVTSMLSSGFGADTTPDLLGVTLQDSISRMDRQLGDIVASADEVSNGRLAVIVTATGAVTQGVQDPTTLPEVLAPVELAVPGAAPAVEAGVPGGLFLDQETLASSGVSSSTAVDALLSETGPDGTSRFADAFAGFAVQFGRYC